MLPLGNGKLPPALVILLLVLLTSLEVLLLFGPIPLPLGILPPAWLLVPREEDGIPTGGDILLAECNFIRTLLNALSFLH